MSKELEALERIKYLREVPNFLADKEKWTWRCVLDSYAEECHTIQKALEDYEEYKQVLNDYGFTLANFREACFTLAQFRGSGFTGIEKSLKALEIIKDKEVDVGELLSCIFLEKQEYIKDAFKEFNCHLFRYKQLTQEEYDLLKEVLL